MRRAVLVILALGALLAATRAEAIPAFARKYQMSCTTCHAPFPRLKAFGEEFAARGFRMPDPTQEPARAVHDVGDPLLRLPRELPLAMRIDGYASWKEDALAETDLEWPWAVKVLSGGPIGEKTAYYIYAILEKGGSVAVEDAWIQFNALGGAPLDLQVGQFQLCDPMFKRELRLERFDYDIFGTRVGSARANLTYDRGAILTWHAPGKVDVLGMLVNGNGIEEAAEDDSFDTDSAKSGALRVVRGFGSARVGLFGYLGRERDPVSGFEDAIWYLGPDVVLNPSPDWQIGAEYLERRDDDPFFLGPGAETVETRGGFLEVTWLPRGPDGRWAWSALYNNVDSDDPGARSETASVTVNRLLQRNLRLVLEGGEDLEHDAGRVSVGLVTAF